MARNDIELKECYLSEWRRRLAHERLSVRGAANVMNMVRDSYLRDAWAGAIPLFSPPQYRPSVLYRTDVELMSSAWPRWPLRTYVALAHRSGRDRFLGFITFRPDPSFEDLGNVLCSAMLFPPEELARSCSIIMADFGNYLGELRGMQGALLVSAPVIDPKGGAPAAACLEGCVSMASWLMARFGARVWGLADIAAVLVGFEDRRSGRYELFTAKLGHARKFFTNPKVGLNAFHHAFSVAKHGRAKRAVALSDAVLGLRSYLRNGFPIICRVPRWYLPPDSSAHVFLLIGYQKRGASPDEQVFVFHDSNPPHGKPMLYGSISAGKLVSGRREQQEGRSRDRLDCVVPVPRKIQAALAPYLDEPGRGRKPGILSRSRSLRSKLGTAKHAGRRALRPFALEDLGEPGDIVLCHRREMFRRYLSQNVDVPVKRSKQWEKLAPGVPEFLWVQQFLLRKEDGVSGIWIWDATKPVNEKTIPLGQCSPRGFWLSRGKGVRLDGPARRSGKRGLKVLSPERLEVALISSFSREQLPYAARELAQHGLSALDLYVFNEADARQYLEQAPKEPLEDALCRADARAVVRRMARHLVPMQAGGVKIAGLTTYLPSVVSPTRRARRMGLNSLLRIVEIADCLRREGHPVRYIELVAGSRVKARSNKRATRAWGLVDVDRKLQRLLDALARVVHRARDFKPPLRFVVEIEPGVVNLVRDRESLQELLQRMAPMREHGLTHSSAGVNLDVSHMRLAGIEPSFFRSRDRVSFVHHAHFDDMAPFGHASDLRVGSLSSDEMYLEWIDLLLDVQYYHELRRVENGYSGYISVEMEAPRDQSQACSSAVGLQMLIEKAVWRRRGFPDGPPLGPWIFKE